jgi:L-2-hydroxyglutarate oxidase LhgO
VGFSQSAVEGLVSVTRADFVVIGAGVVGLTIALELKRRDPSSRVLVLEKESEPALHASGRNSGVLHAGFYYTADSLKARFTRLGNQRMREYCESRNLRINRCGKLVVARDASDHAGLDELLRRARRNGVMLEEVGAEEARRIEPRARTHERALWSPTTATVDPAEVMKSLVADATALGIEVRTHTRVQARTTSGLDTVEGPVSCGYVVNAAGLHADRIARKFGFSQHYRILPFKGLYLYSSEPAGAFRTNIYPVPKLANPFLGVHFTVTVDGHAKIGPTAIPCLWREQYGWTQNFRLGELSEVMGSSIDLLFRAGFDFRGLALEEIRKYHRPHLVAQAAALADGVRASDYTHWGRPGIRAQLFDLRKRTLVQDFMVEGDERSMHVLNAVSPGFTCAFPFSEFVCDEIDRRIGRASAPAEGRLPSPATPRAVASS